MKNIFLIFCTLFIFAGCGLEQNPFKGKNKKFTDSHPVIENPEKPKPIPSDALRIEAESIMNFKEGTASVYEVHPRIFTDGYDQTEFTIENRQEFPGITYDEGTGYLTWQPAPNYVHDDFYVAKMMNLTFVARSGNDKLPPLIVTKNVQVIVSRQTYNAPTFIESLSKFSSIHEGNRETYCAIFEDKDSLDQDGKRPQVQLMQGAGSVNIMPFVQVNGLESQSNNKWKMCLNINLQNIEITSAVARTNLSFRFISRFNVASPQYNVDLLVYNAMAVPTTTWEPQTLINPNEKTSLGFFIMDPKFEGLVSITKQEIPQGSSLNCKNKNNSLMACEFSWLPPAQLAGKYQTISLRVRNQNASISSEFRDSRLDLIFKIAELPNNSEGGF